MCMCTLLRLYIIGIFSCWEWGVGVHINRIPLVFSVGILSFEITDWFQLYVGPHPVRLDYMP